MWGLSLLSRMRLEIDKKSTTYELAMFVYNQKMSNWKCGLLKQPNFGIRSLSELKRQLEQADILQEFIRIAMFGK